MEAEKGHPAPDIVELRPEFADQVDSLFLDSWLPTYVHDDLDDRYRIGEGDIRANFELQWKQDPSRWERRFSPEGIARTRSAWRLALVSGKVAGVLIEGAADVNSRKTDLHALYVRPELQGRGVGTALFEDFRSRRPGWAMSVRYASWNVRARAAYLAWGFDPATERPDLDFILRSAPGTDKRFVTSRMDRDPRNAECHAR